jgi:hypothetical protein
VPVVVGTAVVGALVGLVLGGTITHFSLLAIVAGLMATIAATFARNTLLFQDLRRDRLAGREFNGPRTRHAPSRAVSSLDRRARRVAVVDPNGFTADHVSLAVIPKGSHINETKRVEDYNAV